MKRIILVEDEEIILDLLEKKLSNKGYKLITARDGVEGLKKIKEANPKPDIIVTDILMPKMDGLEMMEEISKIERLKSIPIIVISNSGQPVELDKAKRLGAKDWLIKTEFDPNEVINKIEKLIGK